MSSIRGSTASARFVPLMINEMFRVMAEVPAVIVARVALGATHAWMPRSHLRERLILGFTERQS